MRKYFCKALHGKKTDEDDTIVEITYKEMLCGKEGVYDGMKKMIEKFIELNKERIEEEDKKQE